MRKKFTVLILPIFMLCISTACSREVPQPDETPTPAAIAAQEPAAPAQDDDGKQPADDVLPPDEPETPEPPPAIAFPILLAGGKDGNGKLSAYPFAPGMEAYTNMKVTAQDAEDAYDIELYSVATNPKRNYPAEAQFFKPAAVAMFDMEGTITIAVAYDKDVESVIVRPARAGITAGISDGVVTFDITEWGQYSVEINGNPEDDNLIIFANPPLEEPAPEMRVIEGRIDGMLRVEDGETVYMTPGSIVHGKIYMGSDSTLLGRGIATQGGPAAIEVHGKSNVTINGIAVLDPNRWVIEFRDCDGVTLENVKVISSRNNGDGITIQSSQNMNINKSFVRSWDDSIVLKNYTRNNCYNISVTNCVLWTDLAQSLEIGFETNKGSSDGRSPSPNEDPRIYDILFENIDIIHNFHKAPFSIHNADNCRVYNITYRNIIIDNAMMGLDGNFGEGGGWSYLIDFGNGHSSHLGGAPEWTHNEGYREIKDILVENVWVLGGNKHSCYARFINRDSNGESVMENIKLRNIYFGEDSIDYTDTIEIAMLEDSITHTNEPYFRWGE